MRVRKHSSALCLLNCLLCFFHFSGDVDWDFCFYEFVEWSEFFSHPGNKIAVIFDEPQIAVPNLFRFEESQFASEILNFVSLW